MTGPLDGYKTYIGGAGFILTGIGGILKDWYEGNLNYEMVLVYIGLISTGITVIGGANKVEKLRKAIVDANKK